MEVGKKKLNWMIADSEENKTKISSNYQWRLYTIISLPAKGEGGIWGKIIVVYEDKDVITNNDIDEVTDVDKACDDVIIMTGAFIVVGKGIGIVLKMTISLDSYPLDKNNNGVAVSIIIAGSRFDDPDPKYSVFSPNVFKYSELEELNINIEEETAEGDGENAIWKMKT